VKPNRHIRRSREIKKKFRKWYEDSTDILKHPMERHQPPVPPDGMVCEPCDVVMTHRGVPKDIPRTQAYTYWFDNDQNPDYDARKYRLKPVCEFHMKLYSAMWSLHCRQKGLDEPTPDGQDDLYGELDPGSGDMEPEELEALMTKSLNERLQREGRLKFSENDVLEAALEWTKDDILILQAFARVIEASESPGGYHSGGPPDIVDQ
jgi:hypothetical protein